MPVRVMAKPPGEFIRDHLVEVGGIDYVQAIHKAYKAHLKAQGLKDQACRATMSKYIWVANRLGLVVFDHAEAPERWGDIVDGVPVLPGYVREPRPYAPSPRHYYRIVDPTDPRWVRLEASYRESIGLAVGPAFPRVPVPPPVERVARVPKPPKVPKVPKVPKPLKPPKPPKPPRPPRVLAAPYVARAEEISALLSQLLATPSLEAVGEIESQLVDLGYEVIAAARKAKGAEQENLFDLNIRLRRALEDIGLLRASLQAMISETLPSRIPIVQRAFAASIQVLKQNLAGG